MIKCMHVAGVHELYGYIRINISFIFLQNFSPWHSRSAFDDAFVSDTADEAVQQPDLDGSDDREDGKDWDTVEDEMDADDEPNEDEEHISQRDATWGITEQVTSTVSATVPEPHVPLWTGFRIVGDNVDKNVQRSFQRIGSTTQSLHYFNAYAVLDCIDFSGLSDLVPSTVVDPVSICPTSDDICILEDDFQILTSRYIFMKINMHPHMQYLNDCICKGWCMHACM